MLKVMQYVNQRGIYQDLYGGYKLAYWGKFREQSLKELTIFGYQGTELP